MSRDLFAREALAQIPKILTLMDRNPHSPTYGCFDRNFWHYKIIDFPSGMSQEFVWPLALAYWTDLPENRFFHQPVLCDWIEAGIRFAARSAHRDGSCDDYFPFERASGAAAFSLLACVESYDLMDLDDSHICEFFQKRADWLTRHMETGRLANHQALIALCLQRLGRLLDTSRWSDALEERLDTVLSWQDPEGWFQEYEGCDPGYHTLTISCLSRILEQRQDDDRLRTALTRAIRLAEHFVHPDGSFGGEYTSRNTYNYFPHGFEVAGKWMPEALAINDRFLRGLAADLAPCYADDHIIGHHTWNYLLAWRDFIAHRPPHTARQPGRVYLANAGILIDRRGSDELYLGLNKGGVFKLFRDAKLIASDTQVSLCVDQGGKRKNAVGHLVGDYQLSIENDRIRISGSLGWAKQKQMNPGNLIILRVVMLTVGRFFPNLIRKLLQKLLITGRNAAPFDFTRTLAWGDGTLHVRDEITAERWPGVRCGGIGVDQTSIYVVMSRTFQPGQLAPHIDLTDKIRSLQPGQALVVDRTI
jgi:hypothetical protein